MSGDPTHHDPLAYWLAWAHPVWMVLSLALTAAALRAGLRLRSARLRRVRRGAEAVPRHVRRAKPAVAMLGLGFVAGPLSAVFLRGWEPFGTAHAWLGTLAVALFAATAALGLRLERRGTRPAVEAHAWLALGACLAAAAALGTGFVLLP